MAVSDNTSAIVNIFESPHVQPTFFYINIIRNLQSIMVNISFNHLVYGFDVLCNSYGT